MIDEKKLIILSMNVLTDGWDEVYVKGINKILELSTATGTVKAEEWLSKQRSTVTIKLIATTAEKNAFKNALKIY